MAPNSIGAPRQVRMFAAEDIFQGAQKLFIKQEVECTELCGIEAKQRYRVSVPSGDGREEGHNVFLYVSEESECCERVCCQQNRSLTLLLHRGSSEHGPVLVKMQKPFACGGCCCPCLRPTFTVTTVSDEPIGTIEDPWKCCVMDQRILDDQGAELFKTAGSVCQAGMFCPCCCDVRFNVTAQEEGKAGEGTKVAEITKMALDLEDCCMKTNRFLLDFGSVTDPKRKVLLFAAAMLLDLQYFETQKNNNAPAG